MSDTLIISGRTYSNVTGFKATNSNDNILTYIRPQGSTTISANGTNIDVSQYATINVAVPVGSTIKNQNKTVTPTKSQQSVTFDVDSNNYTGLGTVTVNAIPSQYITTSDADAVAANLLYNKTAYVNGSKITGTMANNGATGGTITSQGGTYTIPAGYTSGGTVTANLTTGSLTNSIINGAASLEDTNDYAFGVTVNIPAGYYNATELTKTFSSILPAPESEGTAPQLLVGYDLYNHEGELISGSMTNNGAWNRTLDQTTTSVTIPAGYHNGTGTVSHTTVNIPDPTISVSSAGLITASGSWTRGFTTDNSYSKTSQLSVQAATTATPTESEQTIVTSGKYTTGAIKVAAIPTDYVGSGITQRDETDLTASGATVTVPAGYYAEQETKSVATTTHPNPTASINTTTGVITASHTQGTGYVTGGTTTGTLNLTTKAATTITPTESEQTAVAANIYTLGQIKIGAISSTYVGSGITSRSSTDLTVSGATVTAPAGYYSSDASKSVATMTLPTAATSSATSGYTSKATINRSTSDQYINIPVGYNSAGGYYKISAVANGSVTAPSSISGTTATVSTGTNTITLTKTVSVTPNVTTAGYISSGTAGNSSVSLTASVTTKAAATITPGTTNQTIASGTYLTGTQTIAGDADLVAGNIKSGVQIFGVTGSYSGLDTSDATATAADIIDGETAYVDGRKIEGTLIVQTYYTGSTVPSSSLGANGDIYLQS